MYKMRYKYLIFTLFVCVSLLLCSTPAAFAEDGVIDSKAVFSNYGDYNKALREYNALTTKMRKTLNHEILSEQNEAKRTELKRQYDKFCAEQNKRLLTPLQERTKKVVAQIAREKKLSRVYETGVNPNGGVDITSAVIYKLNTMPPLPVAAAPVPAVSRANAAPKKPEAKAESPEPKTQTRAQKAEKEKAAVALPKPQPKREEPKVKVAAIQPKHKEIDVVAAQPKREVAPKKPEAAAKPPMSQPVAKPAPKFAVQIAASYDKTEAEAQLKNAKSRGVFDVRIEAGKDALLRVRAYCMSEAEAKALCARLNRAGLGGFVANVK